MAESTIYKVKISLPNVEFPFLRQTPNNLGIWKDCQFFINGENECVFDAWVVYDQLFRDETTRCTKENTILITAEPPSIKFYSKSYFKQFAKVITCHQKFKLLNIIYSQQGLPWMAGISFSNKTKRWNLEGFKDINALALPISNKKANKVCIITSNKAGTSGHLKRLNFVLQIKEAIPDLIDIFGVGFQPIEDKLDVLANYKYSLVIENSSYPNYWTEKLSDAFIAETYPLYYGCPNILSYFEEESMTIIDVKRPKETIDLIKTLIKEDIYNRHKKNITIAKHDVLYKYNLFELISNLVSREKIPPSSVKLKAYGRRKNALFFRISRVLNFLLEALSKCTQ